ncbi:nucleoside diphosphate-linked moiety X motif protein 13 [Trichinella spiralis]|uniref:nucleoside diphosphate-linked moiety X motif protein 13 n=1 Tax=Trichinella spiralis TaxID=6334 RepID=UPI0001EFB9ED|nr:nucleoside diphosphate-linked moiety X motif protein 13 [Trichinella spiralis]
MEPASVELGHLRAKSSFSMYLLFLNGEISSSRVVVVVVARFDNSSSWIEIENEQYYNRSTRHMTYIYIYLYACCTYLHVVIGEVEIPTSGKFASYRPRVGSCPLFYAGQRKIVALSCTVCNSYAVTDKTSDGQLSCSTYCIRFDNSQSIGRRLGRSV